MKLLNYTSDNFWELLDGHLSLRQVETSSKIEDDVKLIIEDVKKFGDDKIIEFAKEFDKIFIKKIDIKSPINKKINFDYSTDNIIRIIKGTNFDYFSKDAIDKFFNEDFLITNLVDRMGIRLKGPKLENIKNTNIKSEGLVRGVIQVPADGNPIIMLSDHGTVGGYPKIGVVIAADLDLVGQLTPGTKINFKEVSLEEAQNIFKAYTEDTNRYLNECN